jgi:glycosyltransferase involved in cell wall biosynthesis/uncharacterized membrane protein YbhN (UPF0104 family)
VRPVGPAAPAQPPGDIDVVGRSRGARLRSVLQVIVGIIAIAALVWSVASNWDTFSEAVRRMDPWLVAAAAASIFAGLYVNMLSWRSVVAAFGTRLGLHDAARVFFVSQLAKYIPGGIWPIVVSARTGRAAGLAPRVSVASMTVALLMSVTVGAVFATGALFLVPAVRDQYWWAPVLLLLAGVVALSPPVLDRLIALALRLLRRDALDALRPRPFAVAIGWAVTSWTFLGAGLALLVAALYDVTIVEFLLAMASYALAWVSGFVAVIAPAGAGVREIVLGLTLGTFVPTAAVLSIVVVDRVLMTFGDVAMLIFTIGRRATSAERSPLFVTRKFPPSVGGMETLAANTFDALKEADPRSQLIALGRQNRNLIWWIPVASARLILACLRRRDRVVLFGDALTWAVMRWIPAMFRVPALPMVMGLDVTYGNPFYRALVRPALRGARRIVAISTATRDEVIAIGVPPERVHVIVLGLPAPDEPPYSRPQARRSIQRKYGLADSDVLLATTGRLVARKGVRWFVGSVLPGLDERFTYLVAGAGEDRAAIEAAAAAGGVSARLRLLGRISDADRTELLHGADIYVQPNIAVPGDVEGFGLVVTESSQAGLFTIAADREGLIDAVRDGVTGVRVASGDVSAWIDIISRVGSDPDRAANAVRFQREALRVYSIESMAVGLREQLAAVSSDSPARTQRTAARP